MDVPFLSTTFYPPQYLRYPKPHPALTKIMTTFSLVIPRSTALVLLSVLVLLTATLWSSPFRHSIAHTIYSNPTPTVALPVPTNPVDGQLHLPNGTHYILDFRDVDPVNLASLETPSGESFLSQEITRSGMTVLGSQSHRFPGGGLSLVFLLAESHMSIHSWPEHSFVAIDIYTCGDSLTAERLAASMRALLKPARAKVSLVERGSDLTHFVRDELGSSTSGEPLTLFGIDRSNMHVPPSLVDICVNADFDSDCLLWRNASLLFSERSDIQLVEVVERQSGRRCLLLDGTVQFCNSADNELYTRSLTEAVMDPLLERSGDVDVYVIGGGDGWVGNHLIRTHPSVVRSIRIIDIDPLVSYTTQRFFPTNESSFEDPRATYIVADAASWLRDADDQSVDAVIIDCTDYNVESASVLYSDSFYADVLRVLRPGGRFSQQMSTRTEVHEPFQRQVKKSWQTLGFLDTMEWYVNTPSYGGVTVMMGGVKGFSD